MSNLDWLIYYAYQLFVASLSLLIALGLYKGLKWARNGRRTYKVVGR